MITPHYKSIKKQHGIALVLVLWMLSLLVILAMGYSRMMRTETLLTANLVNSASANALAEAGVSLAISELLKTVDESTLKTDGTLYPRKYNQHSIQFSVRAESGKIDINSASSELLYGLLRTTNIPEEDLLSILHAILDWRDKDDLVRTYGAEDSDYNNNGFEYGAKDGVFNSVDELMLVRGMQPELFKSLQPSLTIYSHQAGIYLPAASRDVLSAIPNLSEIDIDNYLKERELSFYEHSIKPLTGDDKKYFSSTHGFDLTIKRESLNNNSNENTITPLRGIAPKYLARTKGAIYTINSEAIVNSTRSAIEAVVLLQKKDNVPYSILSWHEIQLEQSEKENQGDGTS